jgi:pimeloyl-ACP methyl ester carboxylesterase
MTSIHELIKLNLGRQEQYVSLHGNNVENPVLLLLHGGPGIAQIGFIRYFTKELEKEFVVVNWDQRGAGKSFNSKIDNKTLTIKQFVEDAFELTDYLKKRFKTSKIFLSGHSWGTVLGVLAIQEKPENYFAYIGISQVVDIKMGEEISYQYTLHKSNQTNNEKAKNELLKIGHPPYQNLKNNLIQRKWLEYFGGSTFEIKMNKLMQKASSTKEYNLWDWIWRFRKGMQFSLNHFLQELLTVNFTNIKHFKIPIYFMQGQNDFQVPTELVRDYFKTLIAPKKEYLEIENCGHMLPFEKTDLWTEYIIKIKQNTYSKIENVT